MIFWKNVPLTLIRYQTGDVDNLSSKFGFGNVFQDQCFSGDPSTRGQHMLATVPGKGPYSIQINLENLIQWRLWTQSLRRLADLLRSSLHPKNFQRESCIIVL